jgi:hypothetical protein
MIQMMKDNTLDYDFFHWSKYESGLNTDDYVLNKLIENINKGDCSYLPYKGLMDRRFIPVSLLKHRSDWKRFKNTIVQHSGTDTNYDGKIRRFFEQQEYQERFMRKLEEQNSTFKDIMVLGVNMPRSPYQALNPENKDNIWICGKENNLTELTKASSYFNRINNEWSTSPSFYISYLVSGKPKNEYKDLNEKVFDLLAKEIAD